MRASLAGLVTYCLSFTGLAAQDAPPHAADVQAAQGTAEPGARWWRGNLHTHSLWSDGNHFPEMIAAWYAEQGYHFLALSDHNILADHERWMKNDDIVRRGGRKALADYRARFGTDWVETRDGEDGKLEVRLKQLAEWRGKFERAGEFLMIQAEEISDSHAKKPLHMNATWVGEKIAPQGGASVRHVIDRNLTAVAAQAEALGRPILAHLNHPNFGYAVTAEDLAAVVREGFFEVYNGHPSIHHLGDATHASVERLWDIACTLRIAEYGAAPPFGIGTDDSHHYFVEAQHRSNVGRGWVMVRADKLEPAALLGALTAGDFYASSGVTLRDVRFVDGALSLEIEPHDATTRYKTYFIGTRAGYDRTAEPARDAEGAIVDSTWVYSSDIGAILGRSESLTPSYELQGDELYVRAVVTSTRAPGNPSFEGQRAQAWTQPVGWRDRVAAAVPEFGDAQIEGEWQHAPRGIDVDPRGSLFLSFGTQIARTDAQGRLITFRELTQPIGDIAFHGGSVWATLEGGGLAEFDAKTLAPKGTVDFEARVPALASAGGRLCLIGIANADVPEPASARLGGDRGFSVLEIDLPAGATPTAACFADRRFWVSIQGESEQLLEFDPDGKVLATSEFDVTAGLARLTGGRFLTGSGLATERDWFAAVRLAVPAKHGGLERPE